MDASLLKNRDVLERVAIVLLVAAVAAVCFAVLRPFLSSMLWAGILVFSSWPVYRWVRVKVVGNSAVSAAALSPGRDALPRVRIAALRGEGRASARPLGKRTRPFRATIDGKLTFPPPPQGAVVHGAGMGSNRWKRQYFP